MPSNVRKKFVVIGEKRLLVLNPGTLVTRTVFRDIALSVLKRRTSQHIVKLNQTKSNHCKPTNQHTDRPTDRPTNQINPNLSQLNPTRPTGRQAGRQTGIKQNNVGSLPRYLSLL